MDANNSQPTGGNSNLNKIEEDLQKLTKEAASTAPVAAEVPAQTSQEIPAVEPLTPVSPQPAPVSVEPVNVSTTPGETPPPPPNVPVEGDKKGMPLMTIAMGILILALVVVIGYVVYVKVTTPAAPAAVQTVDTPQPTDVPVTDVTPAPDAAATPADAVVPTDTPAATDSAQPSPTP
jgi:hypothetical protein